MELIDKEKVIEEIERRLKVQNKDRDFKYLQIKELEALLSFINGLEVKNVDLDESARHHLLHEHISPLNEVLHWVDINVEMQYHKDIEDAYKAGFELGLKAREGKE